jgi:hypothetical protein
MARAMDNEEYALLASLDLSAAFDLVNIDLLKKRLCLIDLFLLVHCLRFVI